MNLLERFIAEAKKRRKTVVLPEGTDERILQTALELNAAGVARPILIGREEEIVPRLGSVVPGGDTIRVIDPETSPLAGELADLYASRRTNVSARVAARLVKRDLVFGGMLVAAGKADGMVAGAANPTASVIQAAALTIGYEEGISTPSSFFIMVLPDGRTLFYADCAVNIAPTPAQLADIGVSTGRSYRRLMGAEPAVAFLSFSTKGSASHALVDAVREAVRAAREKSPDIACDGEFQADTALAPEVAAKKIKEPGAVAGRATVLIFPDLQSGNIAYKLTQYTGGAEAYGPVLQGFARPVSDLSRGAKVKDIVGVTAITLLQS